MKHPREGTSSSQPAEVGVDAGLLSGSINIYFLFFSCTTVQQKSPRLPPLYIPLPAEGYRTLKRPDYKSAADHASLSLVAASSCLLLQQTAGLINKDISFKINKVFRLKRKLAACSPLLMPLLNQCSCGTFVS